MTRIDIAISLVSQKPIGKATFHPFPCGLDVNVPSLLVVFGGKGIQQMDMVPSHDPQTVISTSMVQRRFRVAVHIEFGSQQRPPGAFIHQHGVIFPPTIPPTGNALNFHIVIHHYKVLDIVEGIVLAFTFLQTLKSSLEDQITTLGESAVGEIDASVTVLVVGMVKEQRIWQSTESLL